VLTVVTVVVTPNFLQVFCFASCSVQNSTVGEELL